MEFGPCCCCGSGLYDIVGAIIIAPVLIVFFYGMVYLPLRLLLNTLGGLACRFLWDSAGVLDAGEYVFAQVARRRGGNPEWTGRRRILYRIPDSCVSVELRRALDTRLLLRLETSRDLEKLPGYARSNSPARWLRSNGFHVRFHPHHVDIRKRLRAGEMLVGSMEAVLDICKDLNAFLDHFVAIGLEAVPDARERCAYCKEPLDGQPAVRCKRCGAPHHAECFQLYSGCSVFGCVAA